VFEKFLNSSVDTVGEDSMQPFRRKGNTIWTQRLKFNEETREARYGSRLLLAVQTPTILVWTSPREIQISVVISLLYLINRGL